MHFFHFIEKLQKKPRQKRKFIAVFTTSICFIFIFLVWLSSFQLNSTPVNNQKTQTVLSPLSPLGSLKKIIAHFVDDLKGIVKPTENSAPENIESVDDDLLSDETPVNIKIMSPKSTE